LILKNKESSLAEDRLMRGALWLSVPYNLGAAVLLAFPGWWPGQWAGLPAPVPLADSLLLAMFVALFGGAYAWLAAREVIDRPLVGLATIGKIGACTVVVALWLAGDLPARTLLTVSGDAVFAAIFSRWLLSSAPSRT
jgi:hypothetical protein